MSTELLYQSDSHRNLLLEDFSSGLAVQANQHVIVDGAEAMILDPGGHKVYSKVLATTFSEIGASTLKSIFLSHQDPDIVAATNGWLMTTDADAIISGLWTRFVPHFGVDKFVEDRLKGIPDEGGLLPLGSTKLMILPGHFMHSPGNTHVYDPVSKILYTSDLGASIGMGYREVPDFDAHIQYMEGFHKRYMPTQAVVKAWAAMVRQLDIEIIAPQHGALFRGKAMCTRFIDWIESIPCGIDLMAGSFKIPTNDIGA